MTISKEIIDKIDEIKESVKVVEEHIKTVDSKLDKHTSSVHRAFPRNDLGEPEFDGHRHYHVDRIQDRRKVEQYKQSVTMKILQGAAGFILMLLGLGAMSWWKGL
jgi:hypothetical protein